VRNDSTKLRPAAPGDATGHAPSLTDFLDLATLQEISDGFAAVANVKATITDAAGNVLTQPVPTTDFVRRQRVIQQAFDTDPDGPQKEGRVYVAPITVNNNRLGTIRMSVGADGALPAVDDEKLSALAQKFGLDLKQLKSLIAALLRARNARPAAIQFLYLLANAIARLCYQEHLLRRRVEEMTRISRVATMLSEARDLNNVLQRTAETVADVMRVKAVSIRLIDRERDELVTRAVHNLSPGYLSKGPILLSRAEIDRVAMSDKGYEYVRDVGTDPRVLYPQEARREGIASLLSVGLRYQGEAIGAIRLYTARPREFGKLQVELMKSIAAQAAGAIENARLLEESREAEALEKQIQMASEVQQRMLPSRPPSMHGIDLASVYVPCHTLGGDFFDFIELPYDNLGMVIADVSGKGVPASLIMASVRAALRAQVDNVYYVNEVMSRLNAMLCRDTKPTEFVTMFYGVLDVPNRRLTYCNAGHPPAMLLRDGQVIELPVSNMVLGVSCDEAYTQDIIDLESGDTMLLYTDGLPDAVNFAQERVGRQRIIESLQAGGATAEIVAQNILWTARRFVGLTARNDDITMMVARIK
jgi:sigma-B regulation protein RsbU (phosphoserine phosphatase)